VILVLGVFGFCSCGTAPHPHNSNRWLEIMYFLSVFDMSMIQIDCERHGRSRRPHLRLNGNRMGLLEGRRLYCVEQSDWVFATDHPIAFELNLME